MMDGKEIIAELRGRPFKCDFCGNPKTLADLEPEEGGYWVCHDCMIAWAQAEARTLLDD